MRSRQLDADTRLTLRHNRIVEARDIDALILQSGSELLAQASVVEHDCADGGLCGFDVEAGFLHLADKVVGVGMQAVLQFVAAGEYLEGLQPCSRNHRRDRVGEQIRAAALTEKVDNLLATRGETTYRATKRLAKGTREHLDFAAEVELLGNTVSRLAYDTCRVALVHHDHGIVLLSQLVNLIQRADIAVHGEDTVGSDDAETLCLRLLELLLEVSHIAIGIAIAHCLAEADTVDNRGVVEGIGDDSVLVGEQRLEETAVGIETSRIEDGVLGAEEIGDGLFELLVGVLRTADETHRSHAVSARVHTVLSRLNEFAVISQAQIVIGAEVNHIFAALHLDGGGLRRDDDTFVFVKPCVLDVLQGSLQVLLKLGVHTLYIIDTIR